MAHLVRCVELSEHHCMGCSLTQVPHPEFSSLKVWRVDHKLLKCRKLVFRLHLSDEVLRNKILLIKIEQDFCVWYGMVLCVLTWVEGSYVAVVLMALVLLPWLSSVSAKHPKV